MDPTSLIGPTSPLGYPAPFWFIELFKVLGFALHSVPMNLWYAGIVVAMLLGWLGGANGKDLARRIMNPMPIVVALGVNLGIVPLLFIQLGYYQVFYPATILMAWPWFAIFVLLTIAYYGVYVYVLAMRHNPDHMRRWQRLAGWVAAFIFMGIGFIFANGLSLMTNVDGWQRLWNATSIGGAPLGVALNIFDGSLWPRWLMMFGLALTTLGAFIVVETICLAPKQSATSTRFALRMALIIYTAGLGWFAATGTWYVFFAWAPQVRHSMFSGLALIITLLTAIAPGLPWLLIVVLQRGRPQPHLAVLTGAAQFGVLLVNAISRQMVQNRELQPVLHVGQEPLKAQWSPLILFLFLFVGGLVVIGWMVKQVIEAGRAPAPAEVTPAPPQSQAMPGAR